MPPLGDSHLKLFGMRMKKYYLGFYRDYSIRDHPVICQAVDNIDFLSCEMLGGDYPLLEVYLPYRGIKDYAFALAIRHNASFVEINGGKLQRISRKLLLPNISSFTTTS
jgi:hypothetical protein